MKRSRQIMILLGIAMVLFSACEGEGKNSSAAVNNQSSQSLLAPDFDLQDVMTKESVSLAKYRGKVVVLNFWATWCPPCRAEMPDLIALAKKYSSDLVVIGVSFDDTPDVVVAFYKEAKINYPVVMGTEKINNDYGGIQAIPTTFFINKNGEIAGKIVGGMHLEGFEKAVLPLLK